MGQIGLAGSSKTAPRILIFSIAMGADYSFYVKNIETHAHAFFKVIIFSIGSVRWLTAGPIYNDFGFVQLQSDPQQN